MEQKITKLEMIHEDATKCENPISVAKAISCFHACVNHLEADIKNKYDEALKAFSIKDIMIIISNRFLLELSVNLILNSIPEGPEREAFQKKAERAYDEFSTEIIHKGGAKA